MAASSSESKRRARRVAMAVAIVAVAACLVTLLRKNVGARVPEPEGLATATPVMAASPAGVPGDRAILAPSPAGPPADAIIRQVQLDRTEACVDESALVTVVVNHPEHVTVSINGQGGNPQALRLTTPGVRHVLITAADDRGRSETSRVEIKAHDCAGAVSFVEIQRDPAVDSDLVRYRAAPHFARPECARAHRRADPACQTARDPEDRVTYHWSFGDLTEVDTKVGYAEHSYEGRPMDRPESDFLVKVVVQSAKHGTFEGYTTTTFVNQSLVNKRRTGVISPLARTSNARRSGESYLFDVTFKNMDPASLTLQGVLVTSTPCDAQAGAPTTTTMQARHLLDGTVLASGTTVVHASLPVSVVGEHACSVLFQADGVASDRSSVQATFGTRLTDPVAATFSASSDDPKDQQRFARVTKALKLLGRDTATGEVTVTDDEMHALAMQGLLDD